MEELIRKCRELRLRSWTDNLERVMEDAAQKNWTMTRSLEHLLNLELEKRRQARVNNCFKSSRLDEKQTIDRFDFAFHASRKEQKARILRLLDLDFIKEKRDVIFIGNTGLGKSFLAKCLAYAATQDGIKTLFTSTIEMINQLIAAEAEKNLLKKLHYYQSFDLLVCDEIGYLSLGTQGSNLFFQVITARHQKKSTAITTNLPFSAWGSVFESTPVATVIVDRLVFRSEIIILEGPSYRTKDHR
jgi:DNA replication protein DnaC